MLLGYVKPVCGVTSAGYGVSLHLLIGKPNFVQPGVRNFHLLIFILEYNPFENLHLERVLMMLSTTSLVGPLGQSYYCCYRLFAIFHRIKSFKFLFFIGLAFALFVFDTVMVFKVKKLFAISVMFSSNSNNIYDTT